MRLLRFQLPSDYNSIGGNEHGHEPLWGLVEGEWVVCLDSPPFDGVTPGKARSLRYSRARSWLSE
jgi:hypothetical protein